MRSARCRSTYGRNAERPRRARVLAASRAVGDAVASSNASRCPEDPARSGSRDSRTAGVPPPWKNGDARAKRKTVVHACAVHGVSRRRIPRETLSSICLASSFFSAFSSSRAFGRRASDTSIPAELGLEFIVARRGDAMFAAVI